MKRRIATGVAAVAALTLTGCACVSTEAARAYERATSGEYLRYVEADDSLSEAQKQDRRDSTNSFRRLLDEVEGG